MEGTGGRPDRTGEEGAVTYWEVRGELCCLQGGGERRRVVVEVWVPYSLSKRLSSEAREGRRDGREGSFSPPLLRASLWERRARGESGETRVFREHSGEAMEFLEERGEARRFALEDRGESAAVEESGESPAPRLADCTLILTGL